MPLLWRSQAAAPKLLQMTASRRSSPCSQHMTRTSSRSSSPATATMWGRPQINYSRWERPLRSAWARPSLPKLLPSDLHQEPPRLDARRLTLCAWPSTAWRRPSRVSDERVARAARRRRSPTRPRDAFNTAGRAHSISHSSPRSRSRAPALTPTERGSFDSHHNLDALLSAPQRFDRRREGFDGSPRNCCTGYKIEAREQPVELLHHHRQLWRRAAPTSRQWRRWRRRRRRTREWCSALPRRYSQSSTRP